MKKSSYAEIRIKRDGKAMTVPFCELKEGDETIAPGYPHLVCVGDAHDCGDASCDSLVVYDKDGEGFFPEDFMPTPAGVEAVFMQFPPDSGCCKADLTRLMGLLGVEQSDGDCMPFELLRVEGENAYAIGLVKEDVASRNDFDDSHDGAFFSGIRAIMNDLNLETDDGRYKVAGVDTLLVCSNEKH